MEKSSAHRAPLNDVGGMERCGEMSIKISRVPLYPHHFPLIRRACDARAHCINEHHEPFTPRTSDKMTMAVCNMQMEHVVYETPHT